MKRASVTGCFPRIIYDGVITIPVSCDLIKVQGSDKTHSSLLQWCPSKHSAITRNQYYRYHVPKNMRTHISQTFWMKDECCNKFRTYPPHPGHFQTVWIQITWWRHQMESFSALLAVCAGNSPAPLIPSQRPVTRSFKFFLDLCLNKRLSKQSRRKWYKTPSHSIWRHYNGIHLPPVVHLVFIPRLFL